MPHSDLPPFSDFLARPGGQPLRVTLDLPHLAVQAAERNGDGHGDDARSQWRLTETAGSLQLSAPRPEAAVPAVHLWAALEAAFSAHPQHAAITLALPAALLAPLAQAGLLRADQRADAPTLWREALWQHPALWLAQPQPAPHPLQYTLSQGRRHPRRPAKPSGTVYQRHIPWLGQSLSFRTVDIAQDLPMFSRWMNDPVVAEFWQEGGDLARHRAYLEGLAVDPRVLSLIGCFDRQPFGYFEAYWAKEDRIAPFCDAQDFDRGWHALVGEARFRGAPWLTAWMPGMSHCLFLDDCRTQRIVIEPRADNARMIRSLSRCGYALMKEFDFPHKRAMLGQLLRERFFGEALWIPARPGASL
ncbi:MAG TPA: GNAT family N-acetyltransferase [Ideonella sp.]|uniref:GNAT family N-acetyltransferase n=1 Tax=Ideonella sp. TaxID=1929293 RepID=UPI002C742575|nr:GNAT family N-acetyltransferase [Ideonella sp.]HSI49076.1 GNAT family N-acetyltransferase [Ideonella sp.]